MDRVRTILVLGYWVLGNIHRYWVVLLLGDIFCCSDTQYNTRLSDTMLICDCLLNTITVIIIDYWDFLWSLLCSTQVSVLVLGIGIARGQYYWVLDIGCLSWYHSNPTPNHQCQPFARKQ